MAFKNYKHGLKRIEDQGLEYCQAKSFAPQTKKYNFWWNRRRHPGWAAYHANKDKK